MVDTEPRTSREPGVTLDGIGEMIEDRYSMDEQASALCLLSLAYSAERIAVALETLAKSVIETGNDEWQVQTGQWR